MHMGIDETWKNKASRGIKNLSADRNGEIFSNSLNRFTHAKDVRKLPTASRDDLAVLDEQGHGFSLGRGDWPVGFWATIAVELPHIANLLDHPEIKVRYEQFIFVAGCHSNHLTTRIAEIALTVELSNIPRFFKANAIDRGNEILIRHGV